MDPEKTRTLVDKAKGGDQRAFEELVGAFRERLRSRIQGSKHMRAAMGLDVEDVLQDTFLRAFRGLDKFEWKDAEGFYRWLCGVTRYALADAARLARRDAERRADGVSPSRLPHLGPTQSRAARRDERFDRLEAALEKLPADYRQVLVLSEIEGLKAKEIAERMGRTPNAVYHLIDRAQRELRKHFGETESFHLPDRKLEMNPKEEPHAEVDDSLE